VDFHLPGGTLVTQTIALAARSHAEALRAASVILYALLLAAWLVVAAPRAWQRHRPSVPAHDHYAADRLTPGPGPGAPVSRRLPLRLDD
jgi:hypothetical protein